jgi:hypothetical protein
MSEEPTELPNGAPNESEEQFTLAAGKRMSLHNRLLWLEEMHELVMRWSRNRPMMYSDGKIIGPEPGGGEDEAKRPT